MLLWVVWLLNTILAVVSIVAEWKHPSRHLFCSYWNFAIMLLVVDKLLLVDCFYTQSPSDSADCAITTRSLTTVLYQYKTCDCVWETCIILMISASLGNGNNQIQFMHLVASLCHWKSWHFYAWQCERFFNLKKIK